MSESIQILNAHAPNILRTLGLMEIQIAILALLVLAIEHVLRKPLPKIRYALWVVVLIKCLLPPFLSMPKSTPSTIANFELPALLVGDAPITATAPADLSLAAIILLLWLAVPLVMIALAWRRFRALQSRLREKAPVILSEIIF